MLSLQSEIQTGVDASAPSARTSDYGRRIELHGPPDAVFDALTTLTGIAGWWSSTVTGSGSTGGELRPGHSGWVPSDYVETGRTL